MTEDIRERIAQAFKRHWPEHKNDPSRLIRSIATDCPDASPQVLEAAIDEQLEAIQRDADIARRLEAIAKRHGATKDETVHDFMARAVEANDQDAIDLLNSMDLDSRRA